MRAPAFRKHREDDRRAGSWMRRSRSKQGFSRRDDMSGRGALQTRQYVNHLFSNTTDVRFKRVFRRADLAEPTPTPAVTTAPPVSG